MKKIFPVLLMSIGALFALIPICIIATFAIGYYFHEGIREFISQMSRENNPETLVIYFIFMTIGSFLFVRGLKMWGVR